MDHENDNWGNHLFIQHLTLTWGKTTYRSDLLNANKSRSLLINRFKTNGLQVLENFLHQSHVLMPHPSITVHTKFRVSDYVEVVLGGEGPARKRLLFAVVTGPHLVLSMIVLFFFFFLCTFQLRAKVEGRRLFQKKNTAMNNFEQVHLVQILTLKITFTYINLKLFRTLDIKQSQKKLRKTFQMKVQVTLKKNLSHSFIL